MLDAFLEVLVEKEARRSTREEMADAFMALPVDELHKIASGAMKLADYDDHEWLSKFKGTPLYEPALQLEQQCLELDIQQQQQQQARQQETEQDRAIWNAKDGIRLKKRMLDLELLKMESSTEAGGNIAAGAPPAPDMQQEQAAAQPNPQGVAGAPMEGAPKMASLVGRRPSHEELREKTSPAALVGKATDFLKKRKGRAEFAQLKKDVADLKSVDSKTASPLDEVLKVAAELQAGQREDIKSKNFAVHPKGDEPKYPIHDASHARNALTRVRQFGTPSEKAQVFAAITKKYPALATRSDVIPEKTQAKAEKKLGLPKGGESQKQEAPKQKLSAMNPLHAADYWGGHISDAAGYGGVGGQVDPHTLNMMREAAMADIADTVQGQKAHAAWSAQHPIKARLHPALAMGATGGLMAGIPVGMVGGGTAGLIAGGLGALAGGALGAHLGSPARAAQHAAEMEAAHGALTEEALNHALRREVAQQHLEGVRRHERDVAQSHGERGQRARADAEMYSALLNKHSSVPDEVIFAMRMEKVALSSTALGGLVGGGLGAATGLLSSGPDAQGQTHRLRNTIGLGLLGAGVGAGSQAALGAIRKEAPVAARAVGAAEHAAASVAPEVAAAEHAATQVSPMSATRVSPSAVTKVSPRAQELPMELMTSELQAVPPPLPKRAPPPPSGVRPTATPASAPAASSRRTPPRNPARQGVAPSSVAPTQGMAVTPDGSIMDQVYAKGNTVGMPMVSLASANTLPPDVLEAMKVADAWGRQMAHLEKTALPGIGAIGTALRGFGGRALSAAKANPAMLTGAAIGAGTGAIGGFMGGGQPDEQGKTHRLRGALKGAVGGAAVGGAAGYAIPKVQSAMKGGAGFGQALKTTGQDAWSGVRNVVKPPPAQMGLPGIG